MRSPIQKSICGTLRSFEGPLRCFLCSLRYIKNLLRSIWEEHHCARGVLRLFLLIQRPFGGIIRYGLILLRSIFIKLRCYLLFLRCLYYSLRYRNLLLRSCFYSLRYTSPGSRVDVTTLSFRKRMGRGWVLFLGQERDPLSIGFIAALLQIRAPH